MSRLRNFEVKTRFASNEVKQKRITIPPKQKPARISRRQLEPVLALLKRVAAGGDARAAVDAARLVPFVARALVAAPAGQPRARCWYGVRLPDGTGQKVQGLRAAARLSRRAVSTLANALSKGQGKAEFSITDQYGNPALVTVERLA